MTSLASERSWLLDPKHLKMFQQCRRLIHSEFGVKLHLTEDHLEKQLDDYATRTRSQHLVRTWESLRQQIPHLNGPQDQSDDHNNREIPKRIYRGQALEEPEPLPEAAEEAQEERKPRRTQVIYRGRVVD